MQETPRDVDVDCIIEMPKNIDTTGHATLRSLSPPFSRKVSSKVKSPKESVL